MVQYFWSKEPRHVKDYYKKFEKDIQKLLKEKYKVDQKNHNNYQFVCPKFIFEYSNPENEKEGDDNISCNLDSPSTENSNFDVANGFEVLPEFSNGNSPITTPTYSTFPNDLESYNSFNTFPIYSSSPFYDANI